MVGVALISAGCSADRPWIIFEREATDFTTQVFVCEAGGACKSDGYADVFLPASTATRKILGLRLGDDVTELALDIQVNRDGSMGVCNRLTLQVARVGDEATVNQGDGKAQPVASCEGSGCSWGQCAN